MSLAASWVVGAEAVVGQSLSDSFPTCPGASPVPAILPSGAVIILPLPAVSELNISLLEPLKKHSIVCYQHDSEFHQDQHRHPALVPCPSATHCAQLPAPPDSPGFLAQSVFLLTKGSSRWARWDKGPPLHLTKVPTDVTPSGAAPRMEETRGITCGMSPQEPDPQLPARVAQEHAYPTRSVGQGFAPHPTEGHHSQGCSLPPVSIWPCYWKCLKALAELCREKSHRWMERFTPRAGEALHVPRHVMPVSPLLPCSLPRGLTLPTPGTHIPLQGGLERPFTGETGTVITSQSSGTHQMWVTPNGTQSPKAQIEAQA